MAIAAAGGGGISLNAQFAEDVQSMAPLTKQDWTDLARATSRAATTDNGAANKRAEQLSGAQLREASLEQKATRDLANIDNAVANGQSPDPATKGTIDQFLNKMGAATTAASQAIPQDGSQASVNSPKQATIDQYTDEAELSRKAGEAASLANGKPYPLLNQAALLFQEPGLAAKVDVDLHGLALGTGSDRSAALATLSQDEAPLKQMLRQAQDQLDQASSLKNLGAEDTDQAYSFAANVVDGISNTLAGQDRLAQLTPSEQQLQDMRQQELQQLQRQYSPFPTRQEPEGQLRVK